MSRENFKHICMIQIHFDVCWQAVTKKLEVNHKVKLLISQRLSYRTCALPTLRVQEAPVRVVQRLPGEQWTRRTSLTKLSGETDAGIWWNTQIHRFLNGVRLARLRQGRILILVVGTDVVYCTCVMGSNVDLSWSVGEMGSYVTRQEASRREHDQNEQVIRSHDSERSCVTATSHWRKTDRGWQKTCKERSHMGRQESRLWLWLF